MIRGITAADNASITTMPIAETAIRPIPNLAIASFEAERTASDATAGSAGGLGIAAARYEPAWVSQVNVKPVTVSPMRVLSVAVDPDGVNVAVNK